MQRAGAVARRLVRSRRGAQLGLLVAVALGLAVVAHGAALAHWFHSRSMVSLGVDAARLMVISTETAFRWVGTDGEVERGGAAVAGGFAGDVARLGASPLVERAAWVASPLASRASLPQLVRLPGRELLRGAWVLDADPHLADVLGLRLLAGRGLVDSDREADPLPVLVTQPLACALAGEAARGACVDVEAAVGLELVVVATGERLRVVGVSSPLVARSGFAPMADEAVLAPAHHTSGAITHFMARARVVPDRDALARLANALGRDRGRWVEVQSLATNAADNAKLGWGAMAVLVALVVVTLVAVFAAVISVARAGLEARAHELALVWALGATPRELVTEVVVEYGLLTLGGALLGAAATGAAQRLVVLVRPELEVGASLLAGCVVCFVTLGGAGAWLAARALRDIGRVAAGRLAAGGGE